MADIKLVAETRSEFGKGAARRLRRDAKIPAVLYGHGTDPVHVSLPAHETTLALRHANVLFTLDIEGAQHLAVTKDVQRDPVRQVIEHIDLLLVKKGEKITVDVQVVVVGESVSGTIHLVETQQLAVEADATAIPQGIEVSIEGLAAGAVITAADITLPEGVSLVTDGDHVVVTVAEPQSEASDADAGAEAEVEAPAAE